MAIKTAQVVVGTTPTLLEDEGGYTFAGGEIHISNGTSGIFVGTASVTAANGYGIAANGRETFNVGDDEDLYGVTASGTSTVHVLQTKA
jgi:hypothetical protein